MTSADRRATDGRRTRWLVSLTVTLALFGLIASSSANSGEREFCQTDKFRPHCEADEIVLITSAKYGRWHGSRCISREYYLNCSSNVKASLASICSGRASCNVNLPDPKLLKAQSCPPDLVVALQTSFVCVKVSNSQGHKCTSMQTLSGKSGFITHASFLQPNGRQPIQLHVQQQRCRWRIQAKPGQTINVTLLQFVNTSQHVDCRAVGYVVANETNTRICATPIGAQRDVVVYSTRTGRVDISLIDPPRGPDGQVVAYLLKYSVTGCPLPSTPVGTSVTVTPAGTEARVRCKESKDGFTLFCVDGAWRGEVSNCTQGYKLISPKIKPVPYGLFVAIAIGMALGVVLGITLLVLVYTCYRRHRHRSHTAVTRLSSDNLLKGSSSASCRACPIHSDRPSSPLVAARLTSSSAHECHYHSTIPMVTIKDGDKLISCDATKMTGNGLPDVHACARERLDHLDKDSYCAYVTRKPATSYRPQEGFTTFTGSGSTTSGTMRRVVRGEEDDPTTSCK